MAPAEGDTCHARFHTHKLHLIYVEGGGHGEGGGGGGGGCVIHPPPIKATNDITKRKNGVGKAKEGGGCAWREVELRGCWISSLGEKNRKEKRGKKERKEKKEERKGKKKEKKEEEEEEKNEGNRTRAM